MIDKVIVLGLIDVRDLEEVGVGPLMEELGLDEETATRAVERCSEEAKLVAVEQEAKKIADASAKAKEAASIAADKAALLALGDSPSDSAAGTKVPDPLEAVSGASSEVTVHDQETIVGEDGTPEELGMQGLSEASTDGKTKTLDEDEAGTAALAEGRTMPPSEDPDKL
jgi:hypothetical protein